MSKIDEQKALEKTNKNIEAFGLTKTFNWMKEICEQKALEAYPPTPLNVSLVDYNSFKRTFYAQGYGQAIQDFMEKACKYLESLTVREFAGAQPERVMDDYDIEEFKNYMKNESEN